MLPDRVSNPGPLTYESGALPIALRGPAKNDWYLMITCVEMAVQYCLFSYKMYMCVCALIYIYFVIWL